MASHMQIPTVTEDDLLGFHTKHFPAAPLPTQFFYSAGQVEGQFNYEDDDLGYYKDGVKRTLSDEQIALFRHTEIQTILRERRLARERSVSAEPVTPILSKNIMETPKPPPQDHSRTISGATSQSQYGGRDESVSQTSVSQTTSVSKGINRGHKWKKRKKQQKERRRRKEANRQNYQSDGEISSDEWDPRRQATGPDAQKDITVDLDY